MNLVLVPLIILVKTPLTCVLLIWPSNLTLSYLMFFAIPGPHSLFTLTKCLLLIKDKFSTVKIWAPSFNVSFLFSLIGNLCVPPLISIIEWLWIVEFSFNSLLYSLYSWTIFLLGIIASTNFIYLIFL